ncbi:MAG: HDOD domain-containing protein [Burkholderiales bacterium]|nr:HDOD domain-containing protein [Burkholderiales bacterium]
MPGLAAPAGPPGQLGRFELLRELGRGAQARVWLAHDPRLQREVALKLLDPAADAGALSEWLNEARAVSRLTHPHIVPVFEADEHRGQPYLVFEYVAGPTLAQARRGRGPMPPHEAVALMLGVLDALAVAHAQGLVHRDLKPSNILLGPDGRARVMDFGIAARASQHDGRIVGTPGYMSPEAARGEAPLPAMDVFAAGVLLGELLQGAPLLRESDPLRAIARLQHEDLVLADTAPVDTLLRGIVQRALARDPSARYDSARSLYAALTAWARPTDGAPDVGAGHATLEFLLRRMRHKTDFPALSASVVRIQRVATSETESLASLSDEILKDVALTNKLLRMVNTAQFTAVAGGGIATVSRAVALVGFAGIRNMALSLVLLEHMNDKAHAAQLKDEFLRALMAGALAGELSVVAREGEEAFLAAMFQNLGRLLTEFYFPEEALQIRQALPGAEAAGAAREAAAQRVLGLSFEDLGAGVAKAWGLPDTLQRALRVPGGEVPLRPVGRGADGAAERLRWLGRSANALADAWLVPDPQAQAAAVAAAADAYAPVLGLAPAQVVAAAQRARAHVSQLAQAMGLRASKESTARRLVDDTLSPAVMPPARSAATAVAGTSDATLVLPRPGPTSHAQLERGLREARAAFDGRQLRLNELLTLVLDAMQRALGLRSVVFCLREPAGGRLLGRLGAGPRGAELCPSFRISPDSAAAGDLFAVVCARGADLLIADSAAVASRLPTWWRERVNAPTFLLLPLSVKGAPVGLIYADREPAGSIVLDDEALKLLRSLRDLVAQALVRGG